MLLNPFQMIYFLNCFLTPSALDRHNRTWWNCTIYNNNIADTVKRQIRRYKFETALIAKVCVFILFYYYYFFIFNFIKWNWLHINGFDIYDKYSYTVFIECYLSSTPLYENIVKATKFAVLWYYPISQFVSRAIIHMMVMVS